MINRDSLYDINHYLNMGYKVVSVTPIVKCVASNYDTAEYGAYVVIETSDNE